MFKSDGEVYFTLKPMRIMKIIVTILVLLLSSLNTFAQLYSGEVPKQTPDTLYFAYKDGIQLIIIDNYDIYNRYGSWMDAIYPRGGSWFQLNRPAPKNVYLFRDKRGKIIKTFNTADTISENSLKDISYINTNELTLNAISDYVVTNHHLKYYDKNNVGLINLKGEIVVPAIYDHIINFQAPQKKKDKLKIVKDNKIGLLDSNLKIVFPPIYQFIYDMPGQNFLLFKNEKCGLFTDNGAMLIDTLFGNIQFVDSIYVCSIFRTDKEIKPLVRGYDGRDYKIKTCFIYDKNYSVITKLEDYEFIQMDYAKSFTVKKDNKFGVVNHLGAAIIPLEYDLVTPYGVGYCVYKNDKSGMIGLNGKVLLPVEFEQNIFIHDQAIYVTKDGLIGVYNLQYKLIAKPQFKNKRRELDKYILTRKDGSEGFVKNQNGDSYYQSPEGEIIKL